MSRHLSIYIYIDIYLSINICLSINIRLSIYLFIHAHLRSIHNIIIYIYIHLYIHTCRFTDLSVLPSIYYIHICNCMSHTHDLYMIIYDTNSVQAIRSPETSDVLRYQPVWLWSFTLGQPVATSRLFGPAAFEVLGMVIPPLIGNPYNGYINPYYLFPLPKSLNKVYQTCHSDMPNSNQLFFSTSPPFTTGWVMLGDPKRSRCIWCFHFPIVLAIVVCQLSWFVICSYRIFFLFYSLPQWSMRSVVSERNSLNSLCDTSCVLPLRLGILSSQNRWFSLRQRVFFAAFFAC